MKCLVQGVIGAWCSAFLLSSATYSQNTYLNWGTSYAQNTAPAQLTSALPQDGFDFGATRNYYNGVTFYIDNSASNPPYGYGAFYELDLSSENRSTLQPGFYDSATRFPFNYGHGLNFIIGSFGPNTLNGFFRVLEAQYAGNGSIERFAVDFSYVINSNPSPFWTHGSFRYNSTIPEPTMSSALVVVTSLIVFRLFFSRNRKTSGVVGFISYPGP
jgi:hypothetical protein